MNAMSGSLKINVSDRPIKPITAGGMTLFLSSSTDLISPISMAMVLAWNG